MNRSAAITIMTATAEALLGEALKKALPAAPAEVLLLGEFAAPWVADLQVRNYRLTALDWRKPENQLLPAGGVMGNQRLVTLGSAPRAKHSFDVVLTLDLAADIHPLRLFDQLTEWLAPQGLVVLAGMRGSSSSWIDYLAALGARCGFEMSASLAGPDEPFFACVFRPVADAPRWRVSHVLPSDFPEIAALFHEVFGHPLSRPLWDWKYGAGRGNGVIVRSEGKVVGHYGCTYRDVLLCGKPDRVAQVGDVMVQAQERGVLTRKGPFFLMAACWPEVYGAKAFGFPNARAMQVAQRMGLYKKAGQLAQVRWAPSAPRMRLGCRVRSLRSGNASDGAVVAALWAAMAHDLRDSVVGVRDWAYLEQRYFSHPHNHYELVLVTTRFSGKPLGVVVLQRLEGGCELMDVIAPLANFERVIDQARRLTGRWGLASMFCWITTGHLPLLLACGGTEETLNVMIPASSWTDDPQSELFVGKWWLMSGDTDFR